VEITELMDQGRRSHRGDDFAALVAQLPDLFNNITEFVTTALATRGCYDNSKENRECRSSGHKEAP
jgi:hypothetical protein